MPSPLPPLLLVIEDSDEDFAILKRIVEQESIACRIDRCMTGDEAIEYLLRQSADAIDYPGGEPAAGGDKLLHPPVRPSLILLDLSLPGLDGAEVLRQIKQTEQLKFIPIVVLAGDMNQREINGLYQQGISGYIVKQVDGAKFRRNLQTFIEYWFVANRLPSEKDV